MALQTCHKQTLDNIWHNSLSADKLITLWSVWCICAPCNWLFVLINTLVCTGCMCRAGYVICRLWRTIAPKAHPQLPPRPLSKARNFPQNGLTNSIKAAYRAGQKRYLNFCKFTGRKPFLNSECTACCGTFHNTLYLATHNISLATIKVYLSAVRHIRTPL